MTTEARTNIFTSSEAFTLHPWPVYCTRGPLQIHRVIPLTQIIDFAFLKICYVGAWKCQGRHPGSEIYWEFIDHQKLLSKEESKGKSRQEAHQNATTVSYFTSSKKLYLANLHIRVFARIQSNVKVLTQFQDSKQNNYQCFSCN